MKINVCDCCGKETHNARFCSRQCSCKVTGQEAIEKNLNDCVNRNWSEIQKDHDEGMTQTDLCKKFKFTIRTYRKAVKMGVLIKRVHKLVHSEKAKNEMSKKQKQWLKDNPEKQKDPQKRN